MMKQKEAVYTAILNVCGEQEGKYEPTKDQRAAIAVIIVAGIMSKDIEYKKELEEKSVKEYVPGLVSNWLRKDTRLNGDTKYVPKNPGSRAGQGDAQMKELRKLLSTLTDTKQKAEVQAFIDVRLAAIQSEKAKAVEIDFGALPAELAAKYAA